MCLEYVVREGGNKKTAAKQNHVFKLKGAYSAITSMLSVSKNCIILLSKQQIQWITPSCKGDPTYLSANEAIFL